MTQGKLTDLRRSATKWAMREQGGESRIRAGRGALALALSAMIAGCINVSTPEEPIVIELNINIRNEVIYRLADDAANTIEDNADIF